MIPGLDGAPASREISWFVPGVPRPKGSKRMVRTKGGQTILLEQSKHERPWRDSVSSYALEAFRGRAKFEGCAVEIRLVFVFPRPKSHLRSNGRLKANVPLLHTHAPDIDKLARSVFDGLQGIALSNDAQVAVLIASKFYTSEGDQIPGVRVCVTPIHGAEQVW